MDMEHAGQCNDAHGFVYFGSLIPPYCKYNISVTDVSEADYLLQIHPV